MPHAELEFILWVENYVAVSTSNAAAWGILVEEAEQLIELLAEFKEKYRIANNPDTHTFAAIRAKNDAKNKLERYVRKIYRTRLLHNDGVTGADRVLLQVPVRDAIRSPQTPPQTPPIGQIDTSIHLQHKIKVMDAVEITKRGGKPAGVRGFEIWRKIDGPQPSAESEFAYFATSHSSTCIVEYSLEVVGKYVWYRFCWVNAASRRGPWSEITGAVIP
jgi:hypothetical protein